MIIEELNDTENTQNIENLKKSYMSKDELIKLIQEINFIGVKSLDLEIITDFNYMITEKGNKTLKPLYKSVRVE